MRTPSLLLLVVMLVSWSLTAQAHHEAAKDVTCSKLLDAYRNANKAMVSAQQHIKSDPDLFDNALRRNNAKVSEYFDGGCYGWEDHEQEEAAVQRPPEKSPNPDSTGANGCPVADHESALFDFTDPILDMTDATDRAEDAYSQLAQNADPGREHTSVVVDDLERLIDDLFVAGSKLDPNKLDHLHGQERAEREVIDLCIDDHYRAKRVASSCTDELREYRRVIRSLAILTEDLILVIGNAQSAGGDITINASTLWPTSAARTKVRNEDLDLMNRLIREAKNIRRQLEGEVRAERHPRKVLYSCIQQAPNY